MRVYFGSLIVVVFLFVTAPGNSDDVAEKYPKVDGKYHSLFNGKDLKGWKFRGGPDGAKRSRWQVASQLCLKPGMPERFDLEGLLVNGGDGRGVDLVSELEHGGCELHVEFNIAKGSNSGIYLQGLYEIQILDSYGKKDKDLRYGDCGSIYNKVPPQVNASKKPGEWQSFSILFRAPRFDKQGKKIADARFLSVVHNGQQIHLNVDVEGPTTASLGGPEKAKGPLLLQGDHGPVAFRNLRIALLNPTETP